MGSINNNDVIDFASIVDSFEIPEGEIGYADNIPENEEKEKEFNEKDKLEICLIINSK